MRAALEFHGSRFQGAAGGGAQGDAQRNLVVVLRGGSLKGPFKDVFKGFL